ncbi:MAG TPA: PHP-associated domain-containing protein [Spirochaetia bacterium]
MTRFDLHVHSALSACAEMIMSPRQIVLRAREAGLTVLTVADHNASAHVPVARRLGGDSGIVVIPGMEVASREEVHVLVYFSEMEALAEFQDLVDRSLPDEQNSPDIFGYQLLYDDGDDIVGCDERLRQVGTSLGLEEICRTVHSLGGAVVPAHVHRRRYSLLSQLGFVEGAGVFDAVEIARPEWVAGGFRLGQRIDGFPALAGSDSHFLEDVGRFHLEIDGTVRDIHDLIREVRDLSTA